MLLERPDVHLSNGNSGEDGGCEGKAKSALPLMLEGSVLTSPVEGEEGEGDPDDRLEEVVGAGNEVEAVASGDGASASSRRAEGAEVEVGDEVANLAELQCDMKLANHSMLGERRRQRTSHTAAQP